MNVYLLEQDINNDYDTFDTCVVIARSEKEASEISPENKRWINGVWEDKDGNEYLHPDEWVKPWEVKVTKVGLANFGATTGVVLASFNAD